MDKAVEQIFLAFNHIARELQVYFISGVLLMLNIFAIDYLYYDSSFWEVISQKQFIVPVIIVSYFLGHICMAFYYVVLEMPKLDKKFNKICGINYKVETASLPRIYKKDKDTYRYFIERYVILSMMRWTMSASMFLIFLTDFIFTISLTINGKFF